MIRRRHRSFVVLFLLLTLLAVAPSGAVWGQAPADLAARLVQQRDADQDVTTILEEMLEVTPGTLVIPAGRYRISRTIRIKLERSGPLVVRGAGAAVIVMEGAGPALQIVGTHFASAAPRGFSDQVWEEERMPIIEGVAFEGAHQEAVAIEAVGTMQLTVSRCHIRKMLHGIHLRTNNRNVIVESCHIYENHGIGIYLDDVNLHQINVTGSHISYCDGGGIVSRRGNVRNLHITGCDLESNMGAPHRSAANIEIDCRDSTHGTAEVAITGCTIQHNDSVGDSANIRIYGHSDQSSNDQQVYEGNITITGNILSDVQHNIHLNACRGVTIVGNTMWMGFQHHLLIENCEAVVVGSNNLDRNPRYNYGRATGTKDASVFTDCRNCVVGGLLITKVRDSEAGLVLRRCQQMNVNGCTILDCSGPELLLDECTDCRVAGCLLRDSAEDDAETIVVRGGDGNEVQ